MKNYDNRIGARRIIDIPQDVLDLLHFGQLETKTLCEYLAINPHQLLSNVLKSLDYLDRVDKSIFNQLDDSTLSLKQKRYLSSQMILNLIENNADQIDLNAFKNHQSDLIRSWTAHAMTLRSDWSIEEKLLYLQEFANDSSVSAREEAWIAVRYCLVQNMNLVLSILDSWTKNASENIRRCAIEATRPRGVWTNHIQELKKNPELGLHLLSPLKNDESKYVQNAVANWLNDASKTQPNWVQKIIDQWLLESDSKSTTYIAKRALRTLNKK